VIIHDARNPIAVQNRERLEDQLKGFVPEGVVVVIGGDGFLLHTMNELGYAHTFLGLNAGRVGFLLNDVEDWARAADRLRRADWSEHRFPLLRADCVDVDGNHFSTKAVNDVYLERASGQTARLELVVDGSQVVETLVSDGIIISTALGSTAYNFSAGGPACHPSLRVLAVTPICPHLPRLSPFALPERSRIDVRVQHPDRRPVRAVADGRYVARVEIVSIGVDRDELRLAYLDGHDFTTRMVRKILHP